VPTGKIKWYDVERGYGFIVPDEGGPDVFIHRSEVQSEESDSLGEGKAVEYETKSSPKGVVAVSIKLTD